MVPSNLDLHGDIGKPGDLDFTNLELSMNMITMNKNDIIYKIFTKIMKYLTLKMLLLTVSLALIIIPSLSELGSASPCQCL